jgi:hypothetical protein
MEVLITAAFIRDVFYCAIRLHLEFYIFCSNKSLSWYYMSFESSCFNAEKTVLIYEFEIIYIYILI